MKIIIPKSFEIGHAQNEFSGVTVILSRKGAIGGCDCRGGAPGTRETDLLHNEKKMDSVNSVVLSGGSAFGLESSCGVMKYLKDNKVGYKCADKIIPIVSGAVIFDLNQKEYNYPDMKMGIEACENTVKPLIFGQVGVGTGATVGKIRGMKYASKGGVGAGTVKVAGIIVTAIVAVNAFGDVLDEKGNIIAGAKSNDDVFCDTAKCLADLDIKKVVFGINTTIGCILTDADITKVEANKLASISHNGLAKAINPVHTDYDGDTMFCLASGKKRVVSFLVLQNAVVEATRLAIINAVKSGVDIVVEYDESIDN